jgi:hypothetical protein
MWLVYIGCDSISSNEDENNLIGYMSNIPSYVRFGVAVRMHEVTLRTLSLSIYGRV